MPAAAIPAITMAVGAAGSGASAAQGKKGQNSANDLAKQQLNLQMAQWQLAKKFGTETFNPASEFWQSLLKGGNAAVQATGPYASLIGQSGAGARSAIATNMPRGGEANLATAQSYNNTSNDISRLYAGMQPMAASSLGQLAGTAFGLAPRADVGGAFGAYGNQTNNAMAGGQGFGNLLFNGMQMKRNGTGGGATYPVGNIG